jgi:hypothetical protein
VMNYIGKTADLHATPYDQLAALLRPYSLQRIVGEPRFSALMLTSCLASITLYISCLHCLYWSYHRLYFAFFSTLFVLLLYNAWPSVIECSTNLDTLNFNEVKTHIYTPLVD